MEAIRALDTLLKSLVETHEVHISTTCKLCYAVIAVILPLQASADIASAEPPPVSINIGYIFGLVDHCPLSFLLLSHTNCSHNVSMIFQKVQILLNSDLQAGIWFSIVPELP